MTNVPNMENIKEKSFDLFTPGEVYEMSRYMAIRQGHIAIGLGTDRDSWDYVRYDFVNHPERTLHIHGEIQYSFGSFIIDLSEEERTRLASNYERENKTQFDLTTLIRETSTASILALLRFLERPPDFPITIFDRWPGMVLGREKGTKARKLFEQSGRQSDQDSLFIQGEWVYTLRDIYKSSIPQPSMERYKPFL